MELLNEFQWRPLAIWSCSISCGCLCWWCSRINRHIWNADLCRSGYRTRRDGCIDTRGKSQECLSGSVAPVANSTTDALLIVNWPHKIKVSAGERLSAIGNDGGTYTLNIVELLVWGNPSLKSPLTTPLKLCRKATAPLCKSSARMARLWKRSLFSRRSQKSGTGILTRMTTTNAGTVSPGAVLFWRHQNA